MKDIKKSGIQIALVLILTLSLVLGMGTSAAQAADDNQVEVAFMTGYVHVPATNSVENNLLPGSYMASTVSINNTPDSTGANVIGPTLTYTPAEGVNVVPIPQYLIPGGPPYIWQFPEIIEDMEYGAGSRQIFVEPFEFTPGVSASYNVSQTVFTGPGTQTVTVSAVPAEDMDELRLTVVAFSNNSLQATVTGASGDGDIGIGPGGWAAGAVINNPTVGMSYSLEVTIALAPGPDVLSFTHKPIVHVVNNSITVSGDEIASVLNRSSELGAWTVETPEDYSWHQVEHFHKRITFPGVIGVPPGLDFIEINHMRIEFDTRPNRDKIKILQAEFGLEPGASYDLDVNDVVVNIDGVVITIPAGSFKKHGKKGGYSYDSKGHSTPKIHMELDFNKGEWSLTIEDIDASIIDNSDGVDVTLQIGYMQASHNVPMWIDYLVYPPQPPDHSGHH